jgi:uncharacterized membrane protein
MKALRRYIVAGILVWLPLGLTILLLRFAIRLMDRSLLLLPPQYRPDALLGFHIPGLGVILTFILLLLTGILAANFVGRAFVGGWESLMDRIPIVRSIYSAAKNFAEIVFSDSSNAFKRVLLIEYPRKGIYSLAFQTSAELGEVQGRTGEVDEALKMIISLGVVVPPWRNSKTAELPLGKPAATGEER